MTQPTTLFDRLRIERTVWMLDARLQDLPRSSRIAKRRELRVNLRAAADELGARQAVRQLGDLHQLAGGYLAAEYGELARRPSWTAAAVAFLLVDGAMLFLDHVSATAFRAGITAANPHPSGTFHWDGLRYLTSDATFRYVDGGSSSDGGAWTPLVYLLMLTAAIVSGRLWRLVPAFRRHRASSIADS